MSKILTLSLNPALDSASEVETVIPDIKLYCDGATLDAGGGGVNVSRALKLLCCDSLAFVALAGPTGNMVSDILTTEGVAISAFSGPGITRQNTAILETSTGRQFRFGQTGAAWNASDVTRAMKTIDGLLGPDMLVVGSGSLPPGVPNEIYANINRLTHAHGGLMILDTSDVAMTSALDNTVLPFHIIRMDRHESEVLAGKKLISLADTAHFARSLILRDKAEIVVLARGADGSLVVSGDDTFVCCPPKVTVQSKVGAGDSFVAALTLGLSRGWPLRRAAAYGTAAAAATVTTPGSALCPHEMVEEIVTRVTTSDV